MICSRCNKVHEDERMFATFRDRKGIQRRRNVCKECRESAQYKNFDKLQQYRKEYNAKHRTEKREKDYQRRVMAKRYVDEIKAKTPCKDCGKFFPPICMDFDHIGPKTKGIANFVSGAYKLDLIKLEIEKCELVCACCHRLRTVARKQNLAPRNQVAN